ncbi:energy transducer TonB [Bdellovibrio sp. 22V]|uniref:energy transducer TonB family protein n=1 Tax=Bdellovibrio TaxID=958 RepID=UPI002543548A|nr:energy transducer TonB [Bdellovibrio sp. 22V]WII72236.1 energy transducer TonB [Bdellovibrio sp. 22V]
MMKSPSFRMYVLLSLVFHFLVVGTLLLIDNLTPDAPKKETVSINFLSPEDLQKLAAAEQALQKKAYSPNNQIVEQSETSSSEEVPENSRFLSAKNQVVKKQTVAAERGQFQNTKKPSAEKTGPKGDGKAKSVAKSEEAKKEIAKNLFKGFDASEALERQKQAANDSGLGEGRGNGEQNTGTGAEKSQTNDYIKDVETGLETVLNTREFKYYSYYNRIRKQLAQHWEGRVREKLSKMFKEGRSPAATNKDRITKLMIVLNDKGTLVRVQVLSDSGVRDLDDAAIEAFRAAAPFPNPPKGIVEGDGTVKIRWDFVLET